MRWTNGSRASARLAAAAILTGALSTNLFAEPAASEYGCYSFTFDVTLKGTPEEVFDAATGDISPWWDHTFSGDPLELSIDPVAGGAFFEKFDDEGNGVLHARVIYAERGKLLRMRGPLGYSGKAMDGVYTYSFAPEGEDTKLTFTANLAGQITADGASTVEQVWRHFLIERLEPYLEGGGR